MSDCKHMQFDAHVGVNRLEDSGRFHADVRIWCKQCGRPFQFLGLPMGLDFARPMMSADGQEARMPIAPVGEVPSPMDGPLLGGFRIRMGREH